MEALCGLVQRFLLWSVFLVNWTRLKSQRREFSGFNREGKTHCECGGILLLAGVVGCIKGESGWSPSIPLCFLTVDLMWPPASCSQATARTDLSTVLPYHDELYPQVMSSFLKKEKKSCKKFFWGEPELHLRYCLKKQHRSFFLLHSQQRGILQAFLSSWLETD